MRFLILAGLLVVACVRAFAQEAANGAVLDSDHDGLSDAQEQALLLQFAPRFMISRNDCSSQPAEFEPSVLKPVVAAENSTIYGQAFPRPGHAEQVELHYYDLWRRDCGQRGHDLDAEHVSALLSRDEAGVWKALYWYASAHEDTLCDASQIAHAAILDAELKGPEVWVSSGKHAAFLSQRICARGCGADRCDEMERLSISNLINLGEPSREMNGASWALSPEWPLAAKLRRSDFSEVRTQRLDRVSQTDIAWVNPGKRPAQAAILQGNNTVAGVGTGLQATDTALTVANSDTGEALHSASGNTGNALARAYRNVKKALRSAARGTVRPIETK
jgi:hypothetical protein